MTRIATLIAAPRDSALQEMRRHLLCQAELKLLAETPPDADPVRLVRAWRPDVMLLDAGTDGSDAISTLDRAQAVNPNTRTLVFCTVLTEAFIVRALKHGAKGCLRSSISVHQIVSAIKAVHAGELWAARKTVAQAFEKLLAVHVQPHVRPDGIQVDLSSRELQIVGWMRQGMTNKQIARELGISDTTVKTHAHNIFHKMNISGRVRLLQKLQYAPIVKHANGDPFSPPEGPVRPPPLAA
jgi:two-component system, NarL family, nitrate/nitrite response regulator NarL